MLTDLSFLERGKAFPPDSERRETFTVSAVDDLIYRNVAVRDAVLKLQAARGDDVVHAINHAADHEERDHRRNRRQENADKNQDRAEDRHAERHQNILAAGLLFHHVFHKHICHHTVNYLPFP